MLKYTIKRLLQSLLTVFVVVTIVFLLLRLMPTDYYFTEDELIKLTDEQKDDILQAAGLKDSAFVQLGRFYAAVFRGDLGTSRRIMNGKPVTEVIGDRFGISMRMGCMALIISLLVGIPMGILQARHKDGVFDHFGTAYTIFINAVPRLVSYSLVYILGVRLLRLPAMYSTRQPGVSSILPILCLAMGSIAGYALWMRRYMVDQMNLDYIRLARAKGMTSSQVAFRHVMRNAFIPMAQSLPTTLLFTISGSLYVESLFSIPGMGGLLITSIQRQDNTMVQAMVLLYSAISVVGLLLGDIMMMVCDPRISLVKKGGSR